jgi:hypothetical protein
MKTLHFNPDNLGNLIFFRNTRMPTDKTDKTDETTLADKKGSLDRVLSVLSVLSAWFHAKTIFQGGFVGFVSFVGREP